MFDYILGAVKIICAAALRLADDDLKGAATAEVCFKVKQITALLLYGHAKLDRRACYLF